MPQVLTFLFSDIEGSTALLRAIGVDEYGSLLVAVHRLQAGAAAKYGGVVEGTEGDGALLIFDTAPDALAAAMAAQVALASQDWGSANAPRLRMGIHTGEAERREGQLVGLPIHQAARIAAAANGGQVLVSEATRTTADDALPVGIALLDLGAYRLKDFDDPQHIYQVLHSELVAEHAAIRALPAAGDNLAPPRTTFVGRESEVRELGALMGQAALVTITGPGGAGKTRLAVETAALARPEFADGVWIAELAAITHPEQVASAVASVLNLRDQPSAPLVNTIATALVTKHLLLVLDNCEHVIGACAVLADRLLAAAPSVRLLATSREPLRVEGEHVWATPPLDPSDALRLFAERAAAISPGFQLDGATTPSVAEICRRLDGIPLAVELAAARVRLLAPEEICRRLDDRFRLLTGGGRTSASRQQTLLATVEWSHDLLDYRERALFRRLAAFAGGFTLDAAESVCAAGELQATGVIDTLDQLVAKSLVTVAAAGNGTRRFGMLETLHAFAGDRLADAGELDSVGAAHLAWVLALVGDEVGADTVATVRREADNIRRAVEWAFAHDPAGAVEFVASVTRAWCDAGFTVEACAWTDRALATVPVDAAAARGRVLLARGYAQRSIADLRAADHALADAMGAALLTDDDETWARAAVARSGVVRNLGDFDEAEHLALAALERFAASNDFRGTLDAYITLAFLGVYRGDGERVDALAADGIACARRARLQEGIALLFAAQTVAAMMAERWTDAREHGLDMVSSAQAAGIPYELAFAYDTLSLVLRHEGDLEGAADACAQALAIAFDTKDDLRVSDVMRSAALVLGDRGEVAEAAVLFGASSGASDRAGIAITGALQASHDRELSDLRRDLTPAQLDQLLADGFSLSLDDAVTRAIAALTQPRAVASGASP